MVIFEINKSWVKVFWAKTVLKDVQAVRMIAQPLKAGSSEELYRIITPLADKRVVTKYRPLVLSIPRSQVTLRNLKFPTTDEKELDNIVDLHLTQQVPYGRDEIIHSYTVLDKTQAGFTHVLLAIVHKDELRKQFAVFERLGLYPDNVIVGTMGLIRFLAKAKGIKDGDSALNACLDIDADSSDLVIFKGLDIIFSKSIFMGAPELEDLDRQSKFVGEIRQALVMSQAEQAGQKIEKLYITGVTPPNAPDFIDNMGAQVQLPAEKADPIEAVGSLKTIKGLGAMLKKISISSVTGCAIDPGSRTMSIVLPEAKMRMDVREASKNLVVTGCIAVFIVLLALASFIGKLYTRQSYMDRVTQETYKIRTAGKDTMAALDKIKIVKNFTYQKESFLYYYYKLSEVTPKNITVERIIYDREEEFSLVGKGTAMGEIWKFVKILKDAGTFGTIELRYSRKKTTGDKEFNEFDIICHLGE
jgi:hypothetical protein